MSLGCVTAAVTTGETVSIRAETVAVMSPGCETVAVVTGETVSIGADTVDVMSVTCVTVAEAIETTGEIVSTGTFKVLVMSSGPLTRENVADAV